MLKHIRAKHDIFKLLNKAQLVSPTVDLHNLFSANASKERTVWGQINIGWWDSIYHVMSKRNIYCKDTHFENIIISKMLNPN